MREPPGEMSVTSLNEKVRSKSVQFPLMQLAVGVAPVAAERRARGVVGTRLSWIRMLNKAGVERGWRGLESA